MNEILQKRVYGKRLNCEIWHAAILFYSIFLLFWCVPSLYIPLSLLILKARPLHLEKGPRSQNTHVRAYFKN